MKIDCPPELSARELSDAVVAFEDRLRADRPEVRWIFVEPGLLSTQTPTD